MKTIYDRKNLLRNAMKNKRNLLSKDEIENLSSVITNSILESELYKNAETIFSYLEINSEVKTSELILKSLSDGKKVCIPVSLPKTKEMFFVNIKNLDTFQKGPFGTKIPYYTEKDITKSNNKTLIIVPGLAFDNTNNRLGYGAGYYDAYLETNTYYKAVGFCFDFQIIEKVPTNGFDYKLDYITNKNFL